MQSTETQSIFPGIFRGDIVVSLANRNDHRSKGDILEVLSGSSRNKLMYWTRKRSQDQTSSSDSGTFRLATPEETNWYKSTYRPGTFLNIKDMPKEPVINNNYSIY